MVREASADLVRFSDRLPLNSLRLSGDGRRWPRLAAGNLLLVNLTVPYKAGEAQAPSSPNDSFLV